MTMITPKTNFILWTTRMGGKTNDIDYWAGQGMIDRTLQEGQQYDTYTGYPYTPIQFYARTRHQSAVR